MKSIKILKKSGLLDDLIVDSQDITNYHGYDIPILYLVGDISQISKELSV